MKNALSSAHHCASAALSLMPPAVAVSPLSSGYSARQFLREHGVSNRSKRAFRPISALYTRREYSLLLSWMEFALRPRVALGH